MNKSVKIGLIGFGTVGSGVYTLLKNNSSVIKERTGLDLSIKTICDLKTDIVREKAPGVQVTADWKELVADTEISVIVELMGGIEPAKSVVCAALQNGKHVVTANKKLLAEAGAELFELASGGNAKLGFEAAVGGGIPCIAALKHGLVGNRVQSVMGILNGTTNYILTKMEDENLSFEDALKQAQAAGFAEADPTFDIEGYDAGHKISILAMLAYNKKVSYQAVPKEGITRVSALDIAFAREMGYCIKLLGIAKQAGDAVDVSVHPTMIPNTHPLATVRNEFNAVMFTNDMTGPVIMYGKGAGSLPTASAVVSDIVHISETESVTESAIAFSGDVTLVGKSSRRSRYYLRMHTDDKPGILSKITGVLGKNNISIAAVFQKEKNSPVVPVIILTHEAAENDTESAIAEISGFDFIHGDVMRIRVEDSSDMG